ncbi:unnamed protein product [Boreogadus saida]
MKHASCLNDINFLRVSREAPWEYATPTPVQINNQPELLEKQIMSARKSPADFASTDHPDAIAMRDLASKNYHICVDDVYTRDQKMDHAYRFGTLVCNRTIRYTEREKNFEEREKAHLKQVQFLRREVERLGEVIHQLGLDLETSHASLSASQTNLDATQNALDDINLMNGSHELEDLHCTNASQELDNLDSTTASQGITTASQDTDTPQLSSTRNDDEIMDENGNGDLRPST